MTAKVYWDPEESTVERLPDQLVVTRNQPGIMRAAHWHAQVEVNFVTRGSVEYDMQGYRLRIGEGEIAVFWGSLPHRLTETADDTFYTAVHLPLFQFFRLRLAAATQASLMRGAAILGAEPQADDDASFARWSAYADTAEPRRIAHVIEEVLLRIERLDLDPHRVVEPQARGAGPEDAGRDRGLEAATRMCDYMVTRFRDPIDSVDIAVAADMHPKYAMAVFKRATGLTLGEYLSLLRLSFAQALLVGSARNSVLDVAMEAGFGSISAFNKSFRKMAGMTPSEFKRRHAGLSRAA